MSKLRYRETGEVHMDFHRTTNGTIAHLRKTYGLKFLDEVFRHTAQEVYRAIWEDLKQGDPKQLIAHWTYFFDREKGEYALERQGEEVRFRVKKCPAIAYLQSRGIEVDAAFCRQTVVMNEAWSRGSPFRITTEVLGGGRCIQTIQRKPKARGRARK